MEDKNLKFETYFLNIKKNIRNVLSEMKNDILLKSLFFLQNNNAKTN